MSASAAVSARIAASAAPRPRRRRRIVILTHTSAWGGTEINTLGTVTALAARGHDVTLLQLGHDVYDPYVNASRAFGVAHMPMPQPFALLPVAWWRQLLRTYRPDVCVLSKGGFEMQAPALDIAARLEAKRYVLMEHHPAERPPPRTTARHLRGLVPGLGLWWWRDQLPRRLHLRMAHLVITDSDIVAGLLCDHFALPRRRVARVHCGVDTATFTYRGAARVSLRARWGIPSDALVLGAVGRLVAVKGFDRAIRAFHALRASRPDRDAWLVLAGIGPERDVLRSLAADLGVSDRVVLPGFVSDAADALSALDVFLMPSHSEGFGIALLEAMACERACIAMDSGGPREILTDPSLGWLTPAANEAAFTAAMLAAVDLSAGERMALGCRARAHVVAHFDGDVQSQRIAALIESV